MYHPSRDQLAAFARGRLNGLGSGEVESHIEECELCLALLGHFSEDGFLAALRDAARPTPKCAPTTPVEPPTVRAPVDTLSQPAVGGVPSEHAVLVAGELPGHPQYRIIGLLGHGGMGVVYRAEEPAVGREVAVKVLRDCYRGEPTAGRRFLAEAGVTARLQHPGIPPVFQVGTLPDGSPFLAMKLIAGRTLAELLATPDRPSTAELVTVFEHVCHAVGYAHSRGVMHRDLKPANIMVGEFGEVQVMDWGLARTVRSAECGVWNADSDSAAEPPSTPRVEETHAGAVMGTPAYMAPEQARGEVDRVDRRSDVFGLGAVLCEILTGAPPFTGPDAVTALRMAAAGAVEPAHARLDACPEGPELVALCKRCLAATPDERLADAGAVARAVAELRAAVIERGRLAELERVKLRVEARAGRKRRRIKLALAASLGLLCAGGLTAAWWQDREIDRRRTETALQESDAEHRADRNADALADVLSACEAALRTGDTDRAAAALSDAERRGVEPGGERHQGRLVQCRGDLAVLRDLNTVDKFLWTPRESDSPDVREVGARYRTLLGRFGANPDVDTVDRVVARVAGSAVRDRLVGALDWVLVAEKTERVRTALRRIDPDVYRDTVRDAVWGGDEVKLVELAARPVAVNQPPGFLAILCDHGAISVEQRRKLLATALESRSDDLRLLMGIGLTYPLYQRNTADERLRWFQAALAVAPTNPIVHNLVGGTLRDKGDAVGAENAFRRAIGCDRTFAPAYYNLGLTLQEKRDHAGAEEAFRKTIEYDATFAPARNNLAAALINRRELAEAIAVCRAAFQADGKYAKAHYNLGLALRMRGGPGDRDEARASFRAALAIDPTIAEAHLELGLVLEDAGKAEEAIAEYRAALKCNPKLALAHYNLGVALRDSGDPVGAENAFRGALKCDPKLALAHYNLGAILGTRGDLKGALLAYQGAVTHDPKNAKAHCNLGAVLVDLGDLNGGAAAFKEAVRHDPKHVIAHYNLGRLLDAQDDRYGAIEAYREAAKHDPTFAPAHNNLGVALKNNRDSDGAIRAFREAVKHDPKLVPAHCNLGNILFIQGDLDGAVTSYRAALALDTRSDVARAKIVALEQLLALRRRLPDVAAGQEEPSSPAEMREFAYLCARPLERRYVLSVRLFTRAFAADPQGSLPWAYEAARAAVLSAAGEDVEMKSLGIDEWGILTDLAHQWLRPNLDVLRAQAKDPNKTVAVRQVVATWKADPGLNAVRAREYLAVMSTLDRKRWELFWADVDAVVATTIAAPAAAPTR